MIATASAPAVRANYLLRVRKSTVTSKKDFEPSSARQLSLSLLQATAQNFPNGANFKRSFFRPEFFFFFFFLIIFVTSLILFSF